MRNDIFHIYWSTSGSSGLYLDEIYQYLKEAGYNQKVFVNYYYPFDYGDKVFFRFTDHSHTIFKGRVRTIIQAFELIYALIIIAIKSIIGKPKYINYSLVGGSYTIVVLFLRFVKMTTKATLIVTCHDVIPLTGKINRKREEKNRRMIFEHADYLLVHNNNSILDLKNYYDVDNNKIVLHPFPFMDLKKIYPAEYINKDIDFLFIGVIRPEKGLEILLDSWRIFHKICPSAKLYVCGQPIYDIKSYMDLSKDNVFFKLGYIDDLSYCSYIVRSRFIVLPYKTGTNSGVVSTVFSLNQNIIYSDIPMFKNNPLLNDQLMFNSTDKNTLVKILIECYNNKNETNPNNKNIVMYRDVFKSKLLSTYKELMDGGKKTHSAVG